MTLYRESQPVAQRLPEGLEVDAGDGRSGGVLAQDHVEQDRQDDRSQYRNENHAETAHGG